VIVPLQEHEAIDLYQRNESTTLLIAGCCRFFTWNTLTDLKKGHSSSADGKSGAKFGQLEYQRRQWTAPAIFFISNVQS
jgi:hypothetical protein